MPLDSQFCTFTFSQLNNDPARAIVAQAGLRSPAYCRTKYRHDRFYIASLDDPFCAGKMFGEVQAATKALETVNEVSLVLHDPHEVTKLTSTSTMRLSWSFTYAKHQFRIRKHNVLSNGPGNLIVEFIPPREFKDDPPIHIADFTLRKKGATACTMFDHNIARLRIEDLKGLEICIMLSFFFILDMWVCEGTPHTLMPESERLKAFHDPTAELADTAKREEVAAAKRQDQARHAGTPRYKRLFKRTKAPTVPEGKPVVTRAVMCH